MINLVSYSLACQLKSERQHIKISDTVEFQAVNTDDSKSISVSEIIRSRGGSRPCSDTRLRADSGGRVANG